MGLLKGVKLLFRCTLAIRRIKMSLPQGVWFKSPWDLGPDREQSMIIEHKTKLAAKDAAKTLEQLQITDSVKKLATTQTNLSKGTATTAAAEAGAERAAILAVATVSVGTTTTVTAGPAVGKVAMIAARQLQQVSASLTTTERLKKANEQILNDTIYKYWGDYGQFGDKQPSTTGPYSKDIYTNSSAFLSYDTAHADDRRSKH